MPTIIDHIDTTCVYVSCINNQDKTFIRVYTLSCLEDCCKLHTQSTHKSSAYVSNFLIDDWDEFTCMLLELQLPKVFELIKTVIPRNDWIKVLINILDEIPFYELDDSPTNSGIEWLTRQLNNCNL